MSDEQAKVVVAEDDGEKEAWSKRLMFRKEGKKFVIKSKAIQSSLGVIIPLAMIGILFLGNAKKSVEEKEEIETPNNISGNFQEITLNQYSDTKLVPKKRKRSGKAKVYERLTLVSSSKKVKIPLGASARAVLITGGTNGPVKVKLLEDLESHGEVYIKEGATLWGRGSSTEDRLLISFTKFVNEQGKANDIVAQGYDISDEILGLRGSIIGRTSKRILAGAGLGMAGALQTLQESQNMGGIAVTKPSLENALLNGASGAALGIAEQELEELKNRQTIIEVKKGTQMMVVFGGN